MKKMSCTVLMWAMCLSALTGCGVNTADEITVVSREEGSGTRGAFVELFDIEKENSDGNKEDMTIDSSEITNSTSVVITSVSENTSAIGYISLCALNDKVRALSIDGAEANAENIKNGTYKASRPFNIAVKENLSKEAADFIEFIMSKEGQKVIEDSGYVSIENNSSYSGGKISGKIKIAGSSSVTPVMEKLKEAYIKINTDADIEIQQNDSTTGMISAAEGICDIGMASRGLKQSELEKGLIQKKIAMDGIAVIVSNESPYFSVSSQDINAIYTGQKKLWSEIDK